MSSKLVKKGLDFVFSSNDDSKESKKAKTSQKKGEKRKERKRKHTASVRGGLSTKQGKKKKPEVDFTEQNLKYYLSSTWEIKQDTKTKIVKHKERKRKKPETVNAIAEEDN